jgi:hypothetical protein
MKKISTIKAIAIKILGLLRKILVAFKNHCSPSQHLLQFTPLPDKLNIYEDYYKSQKKMLSRF